MANMGTITAFLGLNDSRFKAGVNNVSKWSKTKFVAMGGAAASAFAGAFALGKMREVIEATAAIKTFSTQAGITADQWQRLNHVIERANGDASDSVSIMLDLKRAMADARTGKKEWVDRFALFGVTMKEIKKDDPVALFDSIGRAVAKSAELTGEQVDALGKMMGEDTSARAIAAFRNNFVNAMGSVQTITDDNIDSIYEMDQAIKQLNAQSLREMARILAENKDDILEVINAASKAVSHIAEIIRFVQSYRKLEPETDKPWYMSGKAQSVINDVYSSLDYKSNKKVLEMAAMPIGRTTEEKESLRRRAWDTMYQKAQLESLKKIQENTSLNNVSAQVMGG
jgi:hypothetical protein